MDNGKKNTERRRGHSPEVEGLLFGKLPFITRHGITLVGLSVATLGMALLVGADTFRQLVLDVVDNALDQIKSRY